jgi:tRNA G18 (ribose-2'-O)-methylase SpoU
MLAPMKRTEIETRICNSCGLRYPLINGDNAKGVRCPACLGETSVATRRSVPAGERLKGTQTPAKIGVRAVLLDNIRSAWNVGSILRSADGFGFDHVYLCGITPTPENEAVRKTSLGAEETLLWSYHKDAVKLADGLKREGWRVIALEEGEGAEKINSISSEPGERLALILGSETTGVDPGLLDLSDEVVAIPMRGVKRSLNVAVAFSVAAFAITQGSGR